MDETRMDYGQLTFNATTPFPRVINVDKNPVTSMQNDS